MGNSMKGKKVLIVEDDPLLHSLLADKMTELQAEGIEGYMTLNADEAFQKAKDVKPDLIMLDLLLPGITGFEFLERLRNQAGLEKTPVVILSNLSSDSDKERAKKLGVVGYLVKANYTLTEIVDAMKAVLSGKGVPALSQSDQPIKDMQWGKMITL